MPLPYSRKKGTGEDVRSSKLRYATNYKEVVDCKAFFPPLNSRLLFLLPASARSKFYLRDPPNDKPDWLKVGLTLGTTGFLWFYLIKQHNEDVLEYKRRNGLE
uniref:NADH dehydrogenase [ubiquinone] 1 subunit C1, mitochondrial n=1 Tax=Sciurus vulgaris TaxID=55149 RepID=A0A8D2B8L4_SCIVU